MALRSFRQRLLVVCRPGAVMPLVRWLISCRRAHTTKHASPPTMLAGSQITEPVLDVHDIV